MNPTLNIIIITILVIIIITFIAELLHCVVIGETINRGLKINNDLLMSNLQLSFWLNLIVVFLLAVAIILLSLVLAGKFEEGVKIYQNPMPYGVSYTQQPIVAQPNTYNPESW